MQSNIKKSNNIKYNKSNLNEMKKIRQNNRTERKKKACKNKIKGTKGTHE